MEGVESIQQLDDKRLHWVTEIASVKREFDATITEQTPDQRIAWRFKDLIESRGHESGAWRGEIDQTATS